MFNWQPKMILHAKKKYNDGEQQIVQDKLCSKVKQTIFAVTLLFLKNLCVFAHLTLLLSIHFTLF